MATEVDPMLAAAHVLGVPLREILECDPDDPRGTRVKVVDGTEYLIVDQMDGAGRTGLMLVRAPAGLRYDDGSGQMVPSGAPYTGTLPVYTPRSR